MNNRGWSLQAMMTFTMVLMICLVIVAVLVKRNFPNIVPSKYKNMELELIEATESYYKNNKPSETSVSVKKLKDKGYLIDFECSGYGIKNSNSYDAYIKCKSYTTKGYVDKLDEK